MSINKSKKRVLIFLMCFLINSASFCQATPVKIAYKDFQVAASKDRVMISWVLSNAIDANYFEVQESADGKNFKTIMFVLGADPKDETGRSYQCFDKQKKSNKKSYYRLKHVDTSGFENLSDIKMLAIN